MSTDASEIDLELKNAGAAALLTLREAAGFARAHYLTCWRAVQRRDLPAIRRGRRILVRRSELARWLARGAV